MGENEGSCDGMQPQARPIGAVGVVGLLKARDSDHLNPAPGPPPLPPSFSLVDSHHSPTGSLPTPISLMASASIKPTSLASSLPSLDSFGLHLLPAWDGKTVASTVAVLVVTLLIAEQSLWRYRKGNLPGFSYQIVSRCRARRGE